MCFWNEGYEGLVNVFHRLSSIEHPLYEPYYICLDQILMMYEKSKSKIVGTWGLLHYDRIHNSFTSTSTGNRTSQWFIFVETMWGNRHRSTYVLHTLHQNSPWKCTIAIEHSYDLVVTRDLSAFKFPKRVFLALLSHVFFAKKAILTSPRFMHSTLSVVCVPFLFGLEDPLVLL